MTPPPSSGRPALPSRPPHESNKPRSRPPAQVDFGLMTPARRVVEELLGVEGGERLVVVHDTANAEVAIAFEHAGLDRRAEVQRIDWEATAERPWSNLPPSLQAAIGQAAATILLVSSEDGEYNARLGFVNAVAAARARHVHMVGTSRRAFLASMTASTARIFALTRELRLAMRPSSRLSLKTALGTHLEVEMAPHLRWFANGNVVRPGQWINVPFGAIVSSPHVVSGVYVADAAVGGGAGARAGLLSNRPVRLVFEAGRLRSVECRDAALQQYVERFVAEGKNRDKVGLLSVGTNMGILSPIGEIVHDENMPGLHLALGETFPAQTGALWSAHGQLAFAAGSCDLDLDGQPLVRHGRYVRFV
jgi:aminopeptidase